MSYKYLKKCPFYKIFL